MKILTTFLLFILFFSCTKPYKKVKKNYYPEAIISNNLQSQYEKTKWALYSIYGPDTVKFFDKSISPVTFGELDLKFDTLVINEDGENLLSFYFYNDSLRCDEESVFNYVASGAGFENEKEEIKYYTSRTSMSKFSQEGSTSKFNNLRRDEIDEYINSNREKVSPWFLNKAIEEGLLN